MIRKAAHYDRNQTLYIIEAALEYLISILVSGSYLATLTKELGFSDSLTGILSSIISLGCLFQTLSLFFRGKRTKRFVILLSVLNQLFFLTLYLLPLAPLPAPVKTLLFVVLIVGAYLLYNLAHPKKIGWLMSLVDDHRRGSFTATKEMVSLIVGTAFSFSMGAVTDHFAERGQLRIAFMVSAGVIFLLMVSHTLTLYFTKEKVTETSEQKNVLENFRSVYRNKNIRKVILLVILYYISTHACSPFLGTYRIGELGIDLKTMAIIGLVGSFFRIVASKFWGRYADRASFTPLMEKCLFFYGANQILCIFTTPANGLVFTFIQNSLSAIALGGLNSAMINLIFDYAPAEMRSDALALTHAIAGTVGFLTTLGISPLVTLIQQQGNRFLGFPVYAQQVVAAIAFCFTLIAILYIRLVLMPKKEKNHEAI